MDLTSSTTAILHELGTIIAATAAVIAALSSLRNGQTLNGRKKNGGQGRKPKPPKNTSQSGDSKGDQKLSKEWYNPPVF